MGLVRRYPLPTRLTRGGPLLNPEDIENFLLRLSDQNFAKSREILLDTPVPYQLPPFRRPYPDDRSHRHIQSKATNAHQNRTRNYHSESVLGRGYTS